MTMTITTTPESTTTPAVDLGAVKARQQAMWASGDFSVVASRVVLPSEQLVDSADLRAGWRVLDVATGSGNAALAAARHGLGVVGVDYVPSLLEVGRARAAAEGLDVTFLDGDAENLPVEDGSFDAVLSVFGAMFAPDQQRAADELARACRPGGTIALASWVPGGYLGEVFAVTGQHVAPTPGVASPMLWGTEEHLADLFGDRVSAISSVERVCTFRFGSPDELVSFFRRWYGPTLKAFDALDADGQRALAADLASVASRWDRNRDGGSLAVPGAYLEAVLTRS